MSYDNFISHISQLRTSILSTDAKVSQEQLTAKTKELRAKVDRLIKEVSVLSPSPAQKEIKAKLESVKKTVEEVGIMDRTIVSELDAIGRQALQITRSGADSKSSASQLPRTPEAFGIEFRAILTGQYRGRTPSFARMHELLTSPGFQAIDPSGKVDSNLLLPSSHWTTPEQLNAIFEMVRYEKDETIQNKIANLLKKAFQSQLTKAQKAGQEGQIESMLNSPLFLAMSDTNQKALVNSLLKDNPSINLIMSLISNPRWRSLISSENYASIHKIVVGLRDEAAKKHDDVERKEVDFEKTYGEFLQLWLQGCTPESLSMLGTTLLSKEIDALKKQLGENGFKLFSEMLFKSEVFRSLNETQVFHLFKLVLDGTLPVRMEVELLRHPSFRTMPIEAVLNLINTALVAGRDDMVKFLTTHPRINNPDYLSIAFLPIYSMDPIVHFAEGHPALLPLVELTMLRTNYAAGTPIAKEFLSSKEFGAYNDRQLARFLYELACSRPFNMHDFPWERILNHPNAGQACADALTHFFSHPSGNAWINLDASMATSRVGRLLSDAQVETIVTSAFSGNTSVFGPPGAFKKAVDEGNLRSYFNPRSSFLGQLSARYFDSSKPNYLDNYFRCLNLTLSNPTHAPHYNIEAALFLTFTTIPLVSNTLWHRFLWRLNPLQVTTLFKTSVEANYRELSNLLMTFSNFSPELILSVLHSNPGIFLECLKEGVSVDRIPEKQFRELLQEGLKHDRNLYKTLLRVEYGNTRRMMIEEFQRSFPAEWKVFRKEIGA